MTTGSHGRIEAYHALQRQCREAVHHGRLERAGVLARRALLVASHSGSASLLHQATTTHSMVLLELGKIAEAEKGLREVVLASTDDETICRAAFYLASSLRQAKPVGEAENDEKLLVSTRPVQWVGITLGTTMVSSSSNSAAKRCWLAASRS
jgi:hypothetical protein